MFCVRSVETIYKVREATNRVIGGEYELSSLGSALLVDVTECSDGIITGSFR